MKSTADKADTATALYEMVQPQSDAQEIKEATRAWELHAHVKESRDAAFAYTKVNDSHAVEVNEWFGEAIDKDERK